MPDCAYCNEFESGVLRFGDRQIHNRTVERGSFLIFPSVGAFLEGWTLISPREHYTSVAALPPKLITELEGVLHEAKEKLAGAYQAPLVFEHGAGQEPCERGACCIEHAHLHLVPAAVDVSADIARNFTPHPVRTLADLKRLWKKHAYLFYENQEGMRQFFPLKGPVPSQYIRQLIWAEAMRRGWDWRDTPRLEDVMWAARRLRKLYGGTGGSALSIEPILCPTCGGENPRCETCSPAERACPFCDPENLDSRVIFETDNFYVIPTKGQVVSGYVLIIPKRHELCLGALSQADMGELIALKRYAQEAVRRAYGKPAIAFEHGLSGQSVMHAHLHVVPSDVDLFERVRAENPRHRQIQSLYELRGIHRRENAYLFYEDARSRMYAFSIFSTPQYLRIVLAELMGFPERGDWRKMDPALDKALIAETMTRLKSALA